MNAEINTRVDELHFALRINSVVANAACVVCGQRTDPNHGPELFYEDGLVCDECGELFAPRTLCAKEPVVSVDGSHQFPVLRTRAVVHRYGVRIVRSFHDHRAEGRRPVPGNCSCRAEMPSEEAAADAEWDRRRPKLQGYLARSDYDCDSFTLIEDAQNA